MLKIILISGYKGAGKDYVADKLSKLIPNSKVFSFAEPLKDIVSITMNISQEELDYYKNNNISVGNTDYRSILQKFGSEAMKKYFGENVWVQLLKDKLPDDGVVIISDWRFMSEYFELDLYYTKLISIRVFDGNLSSDGHISEEALNNFNFDYILDNTDKVELNLQPVLDLVG